MYFFGGWCTPAPRSAHPNSASRVIPNDKIVIVQWSFWMSILLRLHQWLAAPAAPHGLAAFRVLFGLLVAVGNARFVASGWPEKLYGEPRFFFRFAGFDEVWPVTAEAARWCHTAFVPLGVLIALGLLFRPAVVCFTALFAWLQLGDVTNYLKIGRAHV